MEAEGNKTEGNVLTKQLSQLNLPTLAAIFLMGGGNFFTIKNTSEEQRNDTLKAVREIHDLHAALDDFEARQKQILKNQEELKQRHQ